MLRHHSSLDTTHLSRIDLMIVDTKKESVSKMDESDHFNIIEDEKISLWNCKFSSRWQQITPSCDVKKKYFKFSCNLLLLFVVENSLYGQNQQILLHH